MTPRHPLEVVLVQGSLGVNVNPRLLTDLFTPTLCVHTQRYLSGLLTPPPHMMPVCSQSDRLCLGTLTKLVLDLARVARRKIERKAVFELFTLLFTAR